MFKKRNLFICILIAVLVLNIIITNAKVNFGRGNGYTFSNVQIGNGKMIENEIELNNSNSPITSLEFGGISAKVFLDSTASDTIKYKIDEDLEQYLDISQEDNTLKVNRKKDSFYTRNKNTGKILKSKNGENKIEFYVGVDTLEELFASSGITVIGNGTFKSDNIKLDASGASDIKIDVECETANIDASGASNIVADISCETVDIDASGASDIKANLKRHAHKVEADLSGASDFTFSGETDDFNIDLSGASYADLKGKTEKMDIFASGSSDLNARYFKAEDIDISVSGGSSAEIYANNYINASASGSSNIDYWGNATVSKDKSSNADITKRGEN